MKPMESEAALERIEALSDALSQIERAIALLDGVDAPAHIAAHLDLASHQLRNAIDSARKPGRSSSSASLQNA